MLLEVVNTNAGGVTTNAGLFQSRTPLPLAGSTSDRRFRRIPAHSQVFDFIGVILVEAAGIVLG